MILDHAIEDLESLNEKIQCFLCNSLGKINQGSLLVSEIMFILFSIKALGENSKNKSRIKEKLKEECATVIDEDQNQIKTYGIQSLNDYHMPWIEDDSAPDKSRYANFGMFEDRVRELRQHMNNQKTHGLRQLLRDSRDALNYYTSMGVNIFGTPSILLAFASLADTISVLLSISGWWAECSAPIRRIINS
ncbi:hypothetical protein EYC80_004681 [Monilinia laxa]|uniref:Uncharacterized protein n=1 Tax=Monilinia laxa TaxID=61186 RepID=A0A5N6KHH3_MONLA|nr:hypothetical protein EYC80_004681 [Monilinia laxa]